MLAWVAHASSYSVGLVITKLRLCQGELVLWDSTTHLGYLWSSSTSSSSWGCEPCKEAFLEQPALEASLATLTAASMDQYWFLQARLISIAVLHSFPCDLAGLEGYSSKASSKASA